MPTVILDPPPPEVERLVKRRRRLGQDRYDEVWNGVLHMNPFPSGTHADVMQQLAELLAPLARAAGLFPRLTGVNIGTSDDFRGPDGVLQRERLTGVWHPSAALAVEVTSPGDETWEKLPFYAAHNVDEVLIADPDAQKVTWLALTGGEYQTVEHSALIDLGPARLAELIDWPAAA
ncbi:MAG: Uma2 family endonuclease [Actinomycetota bacterium]|nr:Uma2 family endonuclease [Actinomycetota bacterium]